MKSKIILILATVISASALGYLAWQQNTESWTYSEEYKQTPTKDLERVKVRFNKEGDKEIFVDGQWKPSPKR